MTKKPHYLMLTLGKNRRPLMAGISDDPAAVQVAVNEAILTLGAGHQIVVSLHPDEEAARMHGRLAEINYSVGRTGQQDKRDPLTFGQLPPAIPDAPEGWTLNKYDSPGVMRFAAAYWREDAEYKILWSSHERRYVVALPGGNAIKDPLGPMIASGGLMWFATFEEAARAGDQKTVKHVSNGSPEAKYRFRQFYLIARNVQAIVDSFQKSYGAGAVANEVEVRVGDRWVRAADAPPAS